MKKIYGIGIVGTGSVAYTHAKAIEAIDNAVIAGVFNRNVAKAAEFAKKHPAPVFESLDDLLADDRIDIICICTPSGAHLEPALAAISAGKHCLIEKPLEVTVDRCNRIIAAAEKSKVKVGVIFPLRFNDSSVRMKEAVATGKFGTLVLGDAYTKWYRTPEYYQSGKWRGTWQLDGGGALMNQGIHSVDLLQWLMGGVKSVQAVAGNLLHKSIEVEDTIVAVLEFDNGALGTIECSTASYPGSAKRIEIRGTRGTAVIEDDDFKEWIFRDGEDKFVREKGVEEGFGGGASDPAAISFHGHQKQIEDLIRAIETDGDLFVTVKEGKKSVAIIEAIYESAKEGKKVFIIDQRDNNQ